MVELALWFVKYHVSILLADDHLDLRHLFTKGNLKVIIGMPIVFTRIYVLVTLYNRLSKFNDCLNCHMHFQ